MPGPAYTILTPRMALRCAGPEASVAVAEATDASLPELRTWMTWAHELPKSIEAHIEQYRAFRSSFDRSEHYTYFAWERERSVVLGGCGLHPRVGPQALEIGYWVRSDRTNEGLATELAAALTRVAFEVERVRRVEIRVAVGNERSDAVARRLGYRLEATLRERIPLPGDRLGDAHVWTLFADDWASTPAARVPVEAFDGAGRRIL